MTDPAELADLEKVLKAAQDKALKEMGGSQLSVDELLRLCYTPSGWGTHAVCKGTREGSVFDLGNWEQTYANMGRYTALGEKMRTAVEALGLTPNTATPRSLLVTLAMQAGALPAEAF